MREIRQNLLIKEEFVYIEDSMNKVNVPEINDGKLDLPKGYKPKPDKSMNNFILTRVLGQPEF